MLIYASERKLGLESKILEDNKVQAFCPVRPVTNTDTIARIQETHSQYIKTDDGKAYASYSDLYFVDTILVTAGVAQGRVNGGFNKNDDFFSVEEVWNARNTPANKPVNIRHDPNLLCGHMTQSWVLTPGKRKIVSSNTAMSDLPSLIHLACSAVIYRKLNSFYQGEISEIINKIEADEMAVSMEAHFSEFDYALLDESTGKVTIVARNEETAWMTGLLRSFGGEGVYTQDKNGIKEYYRIGRSLKEITFTGKGLVENPANPDSIILNKSFESRSVAKSIEAAGSNMSASKFTIGINTNKKERKSMSDQIDIREYIEAKAKATAYDKLEKSNESIVAKNERLIEDLSKAKDTIANFEFGKKEYEAAIVSYRAEIEAANKDKEEMDKKNKEQASLLEAKDKEVKEREAKCAELEKELESLKAAQLNASRLAMLMEGGIEQKEAEANVKLYASFNDEQFKAVAATIIRENNTAKAFKQYEKEGKISAEVLDQMKITPEAEASEKKGKGKNEKDKEEEDEDRKSKANKVWASVGAPKPKLKPNPA